jgi:hypothetical protein
MPVSPQSPQNAEQVFAEFQRLDQQGKTHFWNLVLATGTWLNSPLDAYLFNKLHDAIRFGITLVQSNKAEIQASRRFKTRAEIIESVRPYFSGTEYEGFMQIWLFVFAHTASMHSAQVVLEYLSPEILAASDKAKLFTHTEPRKPGRLERLLELVKDTNMTPGKIGVRLKYDNPLWCRADGKAYKAKQVEKFMTKATGMTVKQLRQSLRAT